MELRHASELPSALEKEQELVEGLLRATPAVFFDYDGTLTPIVEDPAKATLSEHTRSLLRRLAERWSVVIMSGRGLDDVRALVGVDNLIYAGSHGFSIVGANESFREQPFEEVRPEIDRAEAELRERLAELPGVKVERKLYAIALHYRQADEATVKELERHVTDIAPRYPGLWVAGGKKIFEFRPNVDWNKGKALLHLLDKLHLDRSQTMPLYFGDDVTDEDAFKAIADFGIGILVAEDDQETAARYVLRNPDEVTVLLEELVTLAELEPSTTPWALVYEGFDPGTEQLREALCTLGNGYFATRGAAPESSAGEVHYPGTYMAGVYNRLGSEVAARNIENESIVNVPNWLPLTFRIEDGEWFDLSAVEVLHYRQELDMGQGMLVRTVEFEDPDKRRTRVTQRRFVHMASPHLAGLESTILPINWSGRITVRTALDGRVENTLVVRYRQLNNHHLEP
ncbi:MAG: trehalose-phosphatase, partial [Chloroflexota bacterium]